MNQLIKLFIPAFVIVTNSEAQVFNITDFGALADAKTLNTDPIQSAIDACNKNGDGIDITSCNNVAVSDCDIRTGDDAIAITGYAYHYELPGYHDLRHVSENITVTNCNLQSRSSGIRIGFIDQNSVRNIHISNVNITNSNRGIGIFLRGAGSLENIIISNVFIETRLHTGDWWGNGEPVHISAVQGETGELGQIRHVILRDIFCKGENGILIYGSEESHIQDVEFNTVHFELTDSKLNPVAGGNIDLRGCALEKQLFESDISAFYAQFVDNLTLHKVKILWGPVKENYFTYGIHVVHFNGLKLRDIECSSSPANMNLPAIQLEEGENLKIASDVKGLKKRALNN